MAVLLEVRLLQGEAKEEVGLLPWWNEVWKLTSSVLVGRYSFTKLLQFKVKRNMGDRHTREDYA